MAIVTKFGLVSPGGGPALTCAASARVQQLPCRIPACDR